MTAPDLHRLTRLAALGDAAAAAEVIRWRERQGEAWCLPPYDLPHPKLTDPPEVRGPAMRAWAERHTRNHGAVFLGAWRNDARREGIYYAAGVYAGGEFRTATLLMGHDGPRMLGRDGDAPPPTHCAYTETILVIAWHGACAGLSFVPFYLRDRGTCPTPTFAPCAT